jgi:hypothetical protein
MCVTNPSHLFEPAFQFQPFLFSTPKVMFRLFTKYGIRPNEVRKARKEFFMRLGMVLGILAVFAFLVVLARLGPGTGDSVRDRPTFLGDVERNELRARVDQLEQEFLEYAAGRETLFEEEELALLNEAITLQRSVNQTPDGIVPLRDMEKFEQLSRLRDFHMGNILFSQS